MKILFLFVCFFLLGVFVHEKFESFKTTLKFNNLLKGLMELGKLLYLFLWLITAKAIKKGTQVTGSMSHQAGSFQLSSPSGIVQMFTPVCENLQNIASKGHYLRLGFQSFYQELVMQIYLSVHLADLSLQPPQRSSAKVRHLFRQS